MVIKAIFERACSAPDKPAVWASGVAYSNAQFASGILEAEAMIRSYNLAPGARIGIATRPLDKTWIFILAAEKLGHTATCLPFNSTASQIGLKGIGLWISDRYTQQSWSGPTLWIENDTNFGHAGLFDPGQAIEEPMHDVRFVLYSSGTTGVYKSIASRSKTRPARIGVATEKDRESAVRDRYYVGDFGPWTAFGYSTPLRAFTLGGLVVFEQRLDSWKAILAHQPANMFMTPGAALTFFKSLPADFPRQDDMQVVISGGALTPYLLEMFQSRLTKKITQIYGATEVGLIATTPIHGPDDLLSHRVLDGCEIQAVDEDGEPLPPGQEGVLRVRKAVMIDGYFEDPEATASNFRDGWFYPGDIGVVGGAGSFRLTGRASEVINVNGDKVAPFKFEDFLRTSWKCEDIAVLSEARMGSKDQLHIFVVRPGRFDDRIAKATLDPIEPSFEKIQVHAVTSIPRTTTGKIQYRLLRDGLPKENAGRP